MSELSAALERLARYRQKFADDETIDGGSGLSARDLDVIITVGGTSLLDAGIASEPDLDSLADEPPHPEPIGTLGSERSLL